MFLEFFLVQKENDLKTDRYEFKSLLIFRFVLKGKKRQKLKVNWNKLKSLLIL